jgi:hypothetical protein
VFWGLLITNAFMSAVILVLWITGALSLHKQSKTSTITNPATSQMALAFAEKFAYEYFTWTLDEEEHAQRLQPYLAQGLDRQAGLQMDSIHQRAQPLLTAIWNVKSKGEKQSVVTVMVDLILVPDSKEGQERKEREQSLTVKRWLSIPIQAMGNDRFIVRAVPYLIPEPAIAKVQLPLKQIKGQVVDGSQKKRIERTLQHFFDVYGQGSANEIQYLAKTSKPLQGYRGLMEFVALSDVEMKRQGVDMVAQGQVKWREVDTKIKRVAPFTAHLRQEANRWYVTSLAWE